MRQDPALEPLDEAAPAIARLTLYESKAELRDAIHATLRAVDRSLRILHRAGQAVRSGEPSRALPRDASSEQVVEALLRRRRISLELARAVTALAELAERLETEVPRAADAVVAVRAIALLREDIAEPGTLAEPAGGGAAESGVVEPSGDEAPEPASEPAPRAAAGRPAHGGVLRLTLLGIALVAVAAGGVWVAGVADRPFDEAVRAFTAERWQAAEPMFRQILIDEPTNVTAMLYLARIHRRQGRVEDAAEVLRRAVRIAGGDPDVRRELGHLFVQLGRPGAAAEQYRIAVDEEPDEVMSWIGLVHALRAAGDRRAESVLRAAPAEVRAAMAR